jgi:hypothetical protein
MTDIEPKCETWWKSFTCCTKTEVTMASTAFPPSFSTWSAVSLTIGSWVATMTESPIASGFGPWLSCGSGPFCAIPVAARARTPTTNRARLK